MSHWIHPDAEMELGDAAVHYATHASLAIAEAFLAEYVRVRDLIVENQQLGSHTGEVLRVYHFDRFPYSLMRKTRIAARRSMPLHIRDVSRATGLGAAEPASPLA